MAETVVVRINRVVMLDKFIKYLESNSDTKKNRMLTLASQKEEARKKNNRKRGGRRRRQ